MTLDESIRQAFTPQKFLTEFRRYTFSKTDPIDARKIKITHGCDGVNLKAFEHKVDRVADSVCTRVRSGNYFFSPMIETEVNKRTDLYDCIDDAIANGAVRILSKSTITDRIVQALIYQAIQSYCETKFREIPQVSYAYRSGLSAQDAALRAHRILRDGKTPFVLDADINKFFDHIPHEGLFRELQVFFANDEEHQLLLLLLRRFYSSDRVLPQSYQRDTTYFYKKKPIRSVRSKGIPQGGVLSGLLANIFLHAFDCWIQNHIMMQENARYIRYADDFLLFFPEETLAYAAFDQIQEKLSLLGLTIHPLGEKSNIHQIKASTDSIDFVGFTVSKDLLSIQKKNVAKFKSRVQHIISSQNIQNYSATEAVIDIYEKIKPKILGTESFWPRTCNYCHLPVSQYSWLKFFLPTNDLWQLQEIDKWIRVTISRYIFIKLKRRADLSQLKMDQYPLLVKTYYKLRKASKHRQRMCTCKSYYFEQRQDHTSFDF